MRKMFKLMFVYLMLIFGTVIICKGEVEAKKQGSPTYVSRNLKTKKVKEYKIKSELNRNVTRVAGSDVSLSLNSYGKIVGDSDTRKVVQNTSSAPYKYVCYIVYTYADGTSTSATGWLAGSDVLVTSAHCVYDGNKGGWIKSMRVYPGYKKGGYAPYGYTTAKNFHVYKNWIKKGGSQYDFAIVELNSKIGNKAGYFGFGYGETLADEKVRVTGYPEKKVGVMKTATGRVKSAKSEYYIHTVDTTGGQSGSPLHVGSIVYGIHSRASGGYNSACRITKEKFKWLKSFR